MKTCTCITFYGDRYETHICPECGCENCHLCCYYDSSSDTDPEDHFMVCKNCGKGFDIPQGIKKPLPAWEVPF